MYLCIRAHAWGSASLACAPARLRRPATHVASGLACDGSFRTGLQEMQGCTCPCMVVVSQALPSLIASPPPPSPHHAAAEQELREQLEAIGEAALLPPTESEVSEADKAPSEADVRQAVVAQYLDGILPGASLAGGARCACLPAFVCLCVCLCVPVCVCVFLGGGYDVLACVYRKQMEWGVWVWVGGWGQARGEPVLHPPRSFPGRLGRQGVRCVEAAM